MIGFFGYLLEMCFAKFPLLLLNSTDYCGFMNYFRSDQRESHKKYGRKFYFSLLVFSDTLPRLHLYEDKILQKTFLLTTKDSFD